MHRFLLLSVATFGLALALPRYTGYVNDFAGRLEAGERDALESRLSEYERATTNEVAVAIVSSLEGRSVDDYARQLFHEWGIGKKDRNNGVLLLWAPAERKVRIEVGYGLEGTLSDRAAAEILHGVTDAFRREDYVGGLNAGIDGIIARLDGKKVWRFHPEVVAIPLFGAAGGVVFICLLVFVLRRWHLASSHPKDVERAVAAMQEAGALRVAASKAIVELRNETPEEIWKEIEGVAEEAGLELSKLAAGLDRIRAMPQSSFGELRSAHGALKKWNQRFTALWNRLVEPGKRLDGYRYCREHAPSMLCQLRDSLATRGPGGGWRKSGKFLRAADETYSRAAAAAAGKTVNWLLVYDLLLDAQDCLQRADNPQSYQRRARYWDDSSLESPGYDLLIQQTGTASSGSDSSSSSSGDSSSSFGGGDSGGGGASSSY